MPQHKLQESDLAGFYGTEKWYKNFTGLLYTDGIKFLAEQAQAYWLIDAVGSYQQEFKDNQELQFFQLWDLEVKGSEAVLTMRADSDQPALVRQEIPYTDFPFSIKLYVCNNVLLLPSEY